MDAQISGWEFGILFCEVFVCTWSKGKWQSPHQGHLILTRLNARVSSMCILLRLINLYLKLLALVGNCWSSRNFNLAKFENKINSQVHTQDRGEMHITISHKSIIRRTCFSYIWDVATWQGYEWAIQSMHVDPCQTLGSSFHSWVKFSRYSIQQTLTHAKRYRIYELQEKIILAFELNFKVSVFIPRSLAPTSEMLRVPNPRWLMQEVTQ